jgi:hypothetical protein
MLPCSVSTTTRSPRWATLVTRAPSTISTPARFAARAIA